MHFFFWTYFPMLLTLIFGIFMVNYCPDIAMQAVGVFVIVMMVAVFFCHENYINPAIIAHQ
ncbi:hypothetical protein [Erwinia sp. B116]|uniref:hypothetical protein n=1 Tax=Erwinia sp. B116 TaxID=1561024 RepID=UPI000C75B6F6|nr:hypothetical protein [Erwinia sp. B116]